MNDILHNITFVLALTEAFGKPKNFSRRFRRSERPSESTKLVKLAKGLRTTCNSSR